MTDVPDESDDESIATSTRVPAEEPESDGDAEPTPILAATRAP